MCISITTEVLTNSVDEWNTNVAIKHRNNHEWEFSTAQTNGLAYYLAVGVAVTYALAGVAFFLASKKQKGSYAATSDFEIEDRDIEIGR